MHIYWPIFQHHTTVKELFELKGLILNLSDGYIDESYEYFLSCNLVNGTISLFGESRVH